MEIVLAKGTRQIVGSWTGLSPLPPDSSAVLVPEQLRPGRWTSVYHSDIDQRGKFVFWNVAPGRYRAFVVSGYDEDLWESRDFFRLVAGQGTVLVVPEAPGEESPIKIEPKLLSPAEVEKAASRTGN